MRSESHTFIYIARVYCVKYKLQRGTLYLYDNINIFNTILFRQWLIVRDSL